MTKNKKIEELLEMSYYGHLDQVKQLVEDGVDINETGQNGMTPIFAALNGENIEIIEFLIAKGADINRGDWTIMHESFDYAIDGMIQEGLSEPDPEIIKTIKLLIDKGGDVEKKNKKGNSALDSLNIYASDITSFERLKSFFRPIIPTIDDKIKYKTKLH